MIYKFFNNQTSILKLNVEGIKPKHILCNQNLQHTECV